MATRPLKLLLAYELPFDTALYQQISPDSFRGQSFRHSKLRLKMRRSLGDLPLANSTCDLLLDQMYYYKLWKGLMVRTVAFTASLLVLLTSHSVNSARRSQNQAAIAPPTAQLVAQSKSPSPPERPASTTSPTAARDTPNPNLWLQPNQRTLTDPATGAVITLPRRPIVLGFQRQKVTNPALKAALSDPDFPFYMALYDQVRILMSEEKAASKELAEPLAQAYNTKAASMSAAVRNSGVVPTRIDLENWQPILINGEG